MKSSEIILPLSINALLLFFFYLLARPDPKGLRLWIVLLEFGILSLLCTIAFGFIKNLRENNFLWLFVNIANGVNLYLLGGSIIPLLQGEVRLGILHAPVILGTCFFIVFIIQLRKRLRESS